MKKDPVQDLPAGLRFVDGLFQAASTRTAGFSVVNLAALHAAVQVSYLIMMYVSVFPIAISVRRTNVYEEKSLGIYGTVSDTDDEGNDKEPSYVGAHLRRQLSFDLWYVFLGLFVISIVEGRRIENANDFAFTHFSILFEIISAYGTVGLSLGYPTANTSFSGQFKTLSKLVIIAMQIRGRHRGLPYELDRAVLLPSESLHEKEAAEAKKMLARRRTSLTNMSTRNELSRSKSGPQNGGPRPFPPFAPSPLTQQTATAAQMDPDMGHKLAADFEDSPTPSSDKQTSRGIRAGLGNAMFRLASPLHKKSYEREPDATTKRD